MSENGADFESLMAMKEMTKAILVAIQTCKKKSVA
jgi:hypothetical protein